MGDVFYRELKDASKEIAETKGRARTNGNKALLDTSKQIMEICFIVRREGLPVMEAYTHKIKDKSIAAMIMYAIDGTSSEILEDICWSKYFASELEGYDALIYMIWLKAVLSMQEGEKPVVISERIKAMLPDEVVSDFDEVCAEEMSRALNTEKNGGDKMSVKRILEEEFKPDRGTEAYLLMKIADHVFTQCVDGEGIEAMLNEAEDETIAIAMKGCGSATRKAVFDHLPKKRAAHIAGSMEYMGPVLRKHINEAVYELFKILWILSDDGDIKTEGDILSILY